MQRRRGVTHAGQAHRDLLMEAVMADLPVEAVTLDLPVEAVILDLFAEAAMVDLLTEVLEKGTAMAEPLPYRLGVGSMNREEEVLGDLAQEEISGDLDQEVRRGTTEPIGTSPMGVAVVAAKAGARQEDLLHRDIHHLQNNMKMMMAMTGPSRFNR